MDGKNNIYTDVLRVTPEAHNLVRIAAALAGQTMTKFLDQYIKEKLTREGGRS
jgi:uncharacterized protein (DUF1778 family)